MQTPPIPDLLSSTEVAAREQCLLNSDLLEEILRHFRTMSDRQHLKTQRQSLLSLGLTCKAFSPSAMKFLWRRLNNLLPLLFLLPSFTCRAGVHAFFGPISAQDWAIFHQYAAHVKEIVDDMPDGIDIDSSVYVRLGLYNPSILPNLVKVERRASHALASEILLYIRSPLQMVQLTAGSSIPDTATEMVVASLSSEAIPISSLVLVEQPCSILCKGVPLDHLTSLELRDVTGPMPPSLIRQIGNLPHLRSLSVDAKCFSVAALAETFSAPTGSKSLSHFVEIGTSALFIELIRLELKAKPSHVNSVIPNFLQMIGTLNLESLVLQEPHAARLIDSRRSHPNKIDGDIFHTIVHRWSKTLTNLELEVHNIHTINLKLLNRLPLLRSLRLSGILQGPIHKDISSVFTGLTNLELLSFRCLSFPGKAIPFDIRSIALLAEKCPKLQELDVAISAKDLTPLSSTPTISHSLSTFVVHSSDTPVDIITLARHLDQLFPRLNTIRCDIPTGNTECHRAWADILKLVFVFQDVRRMAFVQR
ncbi:hypothetical protein DFH09DRAFT_1472772 [Mycena vulgaris]|nr:hypothetical protein DFH09DRAFT_1472772 [Mycena vulgaris]